MATRTKVKTRASNTGRRSNAAPADGAGPAAVAAVPPRLTVRHYCQGIGDSHLLTFPKPDGTAFRMLIDCGLHTIVKGGYDTIDLIAADIKTSIDGNPIDVLVVTHEHWDHVSGFLTAKEIFADIVFKDVWMPWTEKPGDPLADELDKHRQQALAALQQVSNKLAGSHGLSRHMQALRDGLGAMMGFYFGATGDKLRSARDAAAASAKTKPATYLEPGGVPLTIPGLPGMRIFVLGPPRDRAMLRLEERKSEMYQFGGRPGWGVERALSAGFAIEEGGDIDAWALETAPFADDHGHDLDAVLGGSGDDPIVKFVADHYSGNAPKLKSMEDETYLADQDWRRIDADWMGIAADLAMQLDQGVNNTSLVLAFEFTDTKRVVLFPGDAQIGNWLSWQSVIWEETGVTAADLLARTVYLKVAHHGSHNATPNHVGLELMTSPDLSAFIPVNEEDAKKAGWHEMPFGTILSTLALKTAGRVIRADDAWISIKGGRPAFAVPAGSIQDLRNEGDGWVELDLF